MALLNYLPPQNPFINFIYRDDFIAVMEKPSGLLSVPGKAVEHKDSLHLRLANVLPTATVVHRLDMATSGIMVFALNRFVHKNISQQFEHRRVKKTYHALVFGEVKKECGTINLALRCDWPNRPKQMIDIDNGKQAITAYTVKKSFENATLVELSPKTGRSHQLRVHMLSLGHPILGDRLYAHDEALGMASRLCLHATQIKFTHPMTEKPLEFNSPLNLETLLNK